MIKPKKPSKRDAVKRAIVYVYLWGGLTVVCVLGMLLLMVMSVGFFGILVPILFLLSFVQWCQARDEVDGIKTIRRNTRS